MDALVCVLCRRMKLDAMASDADKKGSAASEEARALIRKLALRNAMEYGSARPGPVIAKALAADPDLKSEMASLSKAVGAIVSEVNSLPKAELEKECLRYEDEFARADAERSERSARHSFRIEGAERLSFVTRFPPEPGGYMHIGHAKPAFIEDELRRQYSGRLMLYFDDTNPENERQEFVDAIKADLKWLNIGFDGEYYASDNMELLYGYASDAIRKEGAYVCTCATDEIREKRKRGEPCSHKAQSAERNAELWKRMLDGGFADGDAVLRLNAEISSANGAMRDPTLFRLKRARHYRQGERYVAWPTYDFCTPVMDSVNGVTDTVRSKEYEMRDEVHLLLLSILSLRKPRITSISRLEISGNMTSKRRIRELVAKGLVEGWDDPRLVTIASLRRRGMAPAAIREFALSSGISKSESVASMDELLRLNRNIVGNGAARIELVEEPVPLRINGAEGAAWDYSGYKADGELFINASDARVLHKGDTVRLRGAFSITVEDTGDGVSARYSGTGAEGTRSLQWISGGGAVRCELLHIGSLLKGDEFDSGSIRRTVGYAEPAASNLASGALADFGRHGLFKLDRKESMSFLSL